MNRIPTYNGQVRNKNASVWKQSRYIFVCVTMIHIWNILYTDAELYLCVESSNP